MAENCDIVTISLFISWGWRVRTTMTVASVYSRLPSLPCWGGGECETTTIASVYSLCTFLSTPVFLSSPLLAILTKNGSVFFTPMVFAHVAIVLMHGNIYSLVLGCMCLTLNHITLVFSLTLDYQHSNSSRIKLQHLPHSHVSLLSPSVVLF
jgi:hypothetical protein